MSATPAAAIPIPGQAISATPAAAGLPPATVKALLDAAADTSTRFGVDAATAMLLNQIAEHQQQSAEHLATMACAFSTTKLSAFIGVEQATIDAYSTALSNHFSTAINTLIKPQFDQLSQRLDNLEQSGKKARDDIDLVRATIKSDETDARATREYEHFRITALENAAEATWSHLENLGQTVDAAIRHARLEALLKHIQQWEESFGPSSGENQESDTAISEPTRKQKQTAAPRNPRGSRRT